MLKKKILAGLLVVVLILLTACGSGSAKTGNTDGVKLFGDTESRNSLRILMDIQNFTADSGPESAVREFLSDLEYASGLSDVVIEFLPSDGAERESRLTRLRAEIMAGGGPDVFIMTFSGGYDIDAEDTLFTYPQKSMEAGLFLPLDAYMENNTRFAEWEKFTQVIMDAGRNEEGQQIIPLTYTLPVLCYQQKDVTYTPTKELSWNDMLHDPELAPIAADLANCFEHFSDSDGSGDGYTPPQYLECILGKIADFENEELLFSEDELLQRVNEILSLSKEEQNAISLGATEFLIGKDMSNRSFNQPFTLIPMYSDDGGVTVSIQSYAAINRNTKRPEDAFTVIDMLLSTKAQQNYKLYSNYFYNFTGLPMNEELFQQETPLTHTDYYLREENYQELCEIRSQITAANFNCEWQYILHELLTRCRQSEIMDLTVEEMVSATYEDMLRRVRE